MHQILYLLTYLLILKLTVKGYYQSRDGSAGRWFHHFGPDLNIPTTTEWISMKYGTFNHFIHIINLIHIRHLCSPVAEVL